jgi:hypothetical protein
MRITEEAGWVSFDLLNHEPVTSVQASLIVLDARYERPLQAAGAAAGHAGIVADGERVGECQSRRAGSTPNGFVHVCGS